MRIVGIRFRGQAGLVVVFSIALLVTSCFGKKEETPVLPPVTFPLSQPHIGFGVINVSYTGVGTVPGEGGASLGYLRRGTVVQIHERRQIKAGGNTESWPLGEETYKGWPKETLVEVYENESKAQTASEAMCR
jgi:hypothetical protein